MKTAKAPSDARDAVHAALYGTTNGVMRRTTYGAGNGGPRPTLTAARPDRHALRDASLPRPAARIEGGVKAYGHGSTAVRALDGVDLDLERGRFTAIMGPSGSGKSTLLHVLAGLDTLTEGKVTLGDIDVSSLDDRKLTRLRRERIGFIFQAFNLVPTLTAEENIRLPLSIAGTAPEEAWFNRVIETVGLRARLHHLPSELSGGQQQRVAAARALLSRPAIIFADEPTGNLDSKSSAEVLAFMRQAVDEFGQTIVMVTHDAVAASYADQVVFLADGRVIDRLSQPTPGAVLDRMKTLGA
jgi:putative ABC transport system ATP-binding protein